MADQARTLEAQKQVLPDELMQLHEQTESLAAEVQASHELHREVVASLKTELQRLRQQGQEAKEQLSHRSKECGEQMPGPGKELDLMERLSQRNYKTNPFSENRATVKLVWRWILGWKLLKKEAYMSILSLTHLHTCIIISQNEPIWVGRGYIRLRDQAIPRGRGAGIACQNEPIFHRGWSEGVLK